MIGRDDIGNLLIHLTRGRDIDDAATKFQSIVEKQQIFGSNHGIRGGYSCVCFTETPISKIAAVLGTSMRDNFRYSPFGIMVSKKWLFHKGGRPAIYQSNDEFDLLPDSLKYRHVRYEPPRHDHLWEREWRFSGDVLPLQLEETTLIVPNRIWAQKLVSDYATHMHVGSIWFYGSAADMVGINFPWGLIALEDIGYNLS